MSEADYLIIGGGVAGITLALELVPTGKKIVLCESGGMREDPRVSSLSDSGNKAVYPLRATRQRMFGGSSNHWEGYVRPYDSHLGNIPLQLGQHQEKVEHILGVNPVKQYASESPLPGYDDIIFNQSAKRFIDDFDKLKAFPNVSILLHHTCFDIGYRHENGKLNVTQCIFKDSLTGKLQEPIAAKKVILCAGGIENARLPMIFNERHKITIGGVNYQHFLGRYFSDHRFDFFFGGAYYVSKKLLDTNRYEHQPPHHTKIYRKRSPENTNVLMDMIFMKPEPILRNSPLYRDPRLRHNMERIAALNQTTDIMQGKMWFVVGMDMSEPSGFTLSKRHDYLGMPKVNVRYGWNVQMVTNSIKEQIMEFANLLVTKGHGFLQLPPKFDRYRFTQRNSGCGGHHQCTTKMGADENDGCVGYDFKFFGTENLYTVGSSLFRNCGLSNPTFTILMFTLELANQLKRQT